MSRKLTPEERDQRAASKEARRLARLARKPTLNRSRRTTNELAALCAELYPRTSITNIARTVGRAYTTVRVYLKRENVTLRSQGQRISGPFACSVNKADY